MRRYLLTVSLSGAVLLGLGCAKPVDYIRAPEGSGVRVVPTPEGAKASTGGADATITPVLATELLVRSLPDPMGTMVAGEPIEGKNPIPLPDGTRTEYTSITREYQWSVEGDSKAIKFSISDTRGIPALTLFLDSYSERSGEDGYRSLIPIQEHKGWMSYTYGPDREEDGIGSLTLLYRGRFLIQLDGSSGVSAETIVQLAEAIHFEALN